MTAANTLPTAMSPKAAHNPVVVAIDERYNDNDGPSSTAIWWDGVALTRETYAGAHVRGAHDDRSVTATPEQIMAAGEHYRVTARDTGVGHIGCDVTLARSRLAPNSVPLRVVDHSPAGHRRDERICVMADGARVWVSAGCINAVVRYRAPWWCRGAQ